VKIKDYADYCEDRFFLCDDCYNELLRWLEEKGGGRIMTTKTEVPKLGLDWLAEAKRIRDENTLLRKKLAEAKCSLELIMKMTTELLNETEKKSG
jgi:hypothetical protein